MMGAFPPSGLILGRFVLFLGIGAAIAAGADCAADAHESPARGAGSGAAASGFRSAPAHVHRTRAGQCLRSVSASAGRRRADHRARRRAGAGDRQESRFIRFASLGAAAASVLVWLMFWGPGVFGYGTALLWGSYSKDQPVKPFYSITVQPGSKTIRRKIGSADHARSLSGFTSSHANVCVQYASSSKWEEAPMEPQSGSAGFRLPAGGRAGRSCSITWKRAGSSPTPSSCTRSICPP